MRTFPVNKAGLSLTGVVWEKGMDVMAGRWTAIDTETTLIDFDDPRHVPDLVLATVYGGGDFVHLVMWEDVPEYLDLLSKHDTYYVFHNAPFDMRVMGLPRWIPIVDREKVIDTGLQWILYKMGTVGLSDEADEYPKLARVVKDVTGEDLEKDAAVRCTFERGIPIDNEHAEYACGDAVATWLAAVTMAPDYKVPPTMGIQVKGFLCLDDTSRNGMLVDRRWMSDLRNVFLKEKDEAKPKLKDLGINVEKELETKEIIPYVRKHLFTNFPEKPGIKDLRMSLAAVNRKEYGYPLDAPWPTDEGYIKKCLAVWATDHPFGIPENASAKALVNMLWKAAMNAEAGVSTAAGMKEWWDEHEGWPAGYKQEGLATQLQRLMAEAESYCSRPFPRTPSGKIALDDKSLEQIPGEDLERLKFLKELKVYKHAEKMISTYLDEKIVRLDGRVHSRFTPVKSTGRTSSRGPNVQNLPRDDRLRGIYIPDPGYVMCSCDYNQQELIALSQVTYSRFGHSLMRDLINNDIDIHGFMGTTIKGLFKGLPKFDVNNLEIVDQYRKIIKGFKSTDPKGFKKLRQLAKALDFGLPGGLGAKTFVIYATNYGVNITVDEATPLCRLWKDTFPETYEYLEDPGPEFDECAPAVLPEDSWQEREIKENHRYKCVTLTGRKRARCTYTQACNTAFQGLSSDCTKSAMWNMYKAGYMMVNMIHDETITLLPFDRLTTARAKHIEHLMVESMRKLTPDVKVKAEPALMFRWAKSAEPYFAGDVLLPWEIVPKHMEKDNLVPTPWEDLSSEKQHWFMDRLEVLYDKAEAARNGRTVA